MTDGEQQPDPGDSTILKAQFGRNWRAWRWLRQQFTATSLGTIGAIILAGGGYIVHLRESVVQVRERVVVLETKVIPFVQDQAKLGAIDATLAEHDARITRLENNWDEASAQAATAPSARRRR